MSRKVEEKENGKNKNEIGIGFERGYLHIKTKTRNSFAMFLK